MVLTSNRDVAEWPPLFGEELLAGAAMDRLLHHAHLVTIEGDFYRNPPKNAALSRLREGPEWIRSAELCPQPECES